MENVDAKTFNDSMLKALTNCETDDYGNFINSISYSQYQNMSVLFGGGNQTPNGLNTEDFLGSTVYIHIFDWYSTFFY